jgi:Spy/CpxP family protein refolding chaperone
MMAFKAQRDTELNKRAEATKTFYAVLSEEQKKIFDQHTAKFMSKMAHKQPGSHENVMPHN